MITSDHMPVHKAVIIAAGSGARLRTPLTRSPKPLVRVLGVPLLKRVIMSARQAGIREFNIVVGYRADEIRAAIEGSPDLAGLTFKWISNPDWKKANGVSVLKASESVRDPFVLLMADHLFPAETLKALLEAPLGEGETILAIDRKVDEIFDLDDAMKVQVEDGRVGAIAKDLGSYNAIDTGMFLCTPALFGSLRACYERKGDCSLADGVRQLAETGRLRVFDIGPGWWQDVDTPGSLHYAEKLLLRATEKHTDGVVSRHLNRPISHVVSRWVSGTSVTPNQITFANFALALLAAYLVSFKSAIPFIMGAALFQLTSVLDGVDGEVAKLKYRQSRMGEWLDTVTDNLSYLAFFAGVTIGAYKRVPEVSTIWLGAFAVGGTVASLAFMYHYVHRNGRGTLVLLDSNLRQVVQDCSPLVRFFYYLRFAVKRDFFAILFLSLAVAGKPLWILWSGAVASNVLWLIYLLARTQLWQGVPARGEVRAKE
ncbi:MAG: NTP transferase domain-containing protein [Nitrospirae bacterium]|nr:NTP transferase domain-containing protein [Nitrospirota bacterium]